MDRRMAAGRRIVLVLSGEGGVGKSTVSAQMAQGIAADGREVGPLDIDVCMYARRPCPRCPRCRGRGTGATPGRETRARAQMELE